MSYITTTSDYLTWDVNLALHTPEEVQAYITSLDINNTEDVRFIVIQTVDKVITINGISFHAPLFQDGETRFNQAIGGHTGINGNRVKAIHYYPDRDHVMVEYLSHPVDIRPKNTEHTAADFGIFFENLFTVWKTALLDIYSGTLKSIDFEPSIRTVEPTGDN